MVSPLVNSIKDKVDKQANLDILVASLNDISEENALGCKKLFEVNPARGDRPISQTVWDFTYQSNEKIPFRLSVYL